LFLPHILKASHHLSAVRHTGDGTQIEGANSSGRLNLVGRLICKDPQ
jgi:hypothetical protein